MSEVHQKAELYAAGINYAQMKRDDYIKMHTPIVRRGRKIGRNEPCPCGSGKKFKKCHANEDTNIYE